MNYLARKLNLLLTVGLLIISTSYSNYAQILGINFSPKFSTCILHPPQKQYSNVQKIAVLDFKSANNDQQGVGDGAKIADYLTKLLVDEDRGIKSTKTHFTGGTTKVFEVMDRSNIAAMLQKHPQLGDEIDENEATEIGKILGVDAVIIGNCSYNWKDDTDLSTYTDKKGNTSRTYSRNRKLNAEARMSVVDVSTGEFIGSSNGSAEKEASARSSSGYPSANKVKAPEKLAQEAYRVIAYRLANYLAPVYYTRKFTLERVKIKDYKERAKDATDQLKLNNLEPAFQLYNAIYEEDNYNPKVAYNLGVIYEASANYPKALELYQTAYQLDKDEELYDQALARAKEGMDMLAYFEKIGVQIQAREFEVGDAEVLLREKVKIKGKRKDRKLIYEKPDENSAVVQEVPGKMEFSVIEKTEDWILLDLKIGDKRGYVLRKDVKEGK